LGNPGSIYSAFDIYVPDLSLSGELVLFDTTIPFLAFIVFEIYKVKRVFRLEAVKASIISHCDKSLLLLSHRQALIPWREEFSPLVEQDRAKRYLLQVIDLSGVLVAMILS
jgi:hypothetical protein